MSFYDNVKFGDDRLNGLGVHKEHTHRHTNALKETQFGPFVKTSIGGPANIMSSWPSGLEFWTLICWVLLAVGSNPANYATYYIEEVLFCR